jgi:hypothetical protein
MELPFRQDPPDIPLHVQVIPFDASSPYFPLCVRQNALRQEIQ